MSLPRALEQGNKSCFASYFASVCMYVRWSRLGMLISVHCISVLHDHDIDHELKLGSAEHPYHIFCACARCTRMLSYKSLLCYLLLMKIEYQYYTSNVINNCTCFPREIHKETLVLCVCAVCNLACINQPCSKLHTAFSHFIEKPKKVQLLTLKNYTCMLFQGFNTTC